MIGGRFHHGIGEAVRNGAVPQSGFDMDSLRPCHVLHPAAKHFQLLFWRVNSQTKPGLRRLPVADPVEGLQPGQVGGVKQLSRDLFKGGGLSPQRPDRAGVSQRAQTQDKIRGAPVAVAGAEKKSVQVVAGGGFDHPFAHADPPAIGQFPVHTREVVAIRSEP